MLYVVYEQYKTKLYNAQKDLDKILCEKEELFARTQPQSTKYDKEPVKGGSPSNSFDEYLIAKEKKQIEERLNEAKSIVNDRKELLLGKEEELRNSKDWYDKIYVYRFLDNLSVEKIKNIMPYCRSSIYEKIKEIEKVVSLDNFGQKPC